MNHRASPNTMKPKHVFSFRHSVFTGTISDVKPFFRYGIFLAASFALPLHAQTTLSVGDIYVTGFNSNTPDGFAFVLLRDVAAGTDIRFTDNGFLAATSATATNNGRGGENFLRWVAPTGGLTAGSVVSWVNGTGPSVGTVPFGALSGISKQFNS